MRRPGLHPPPPAHPQTPCLHAAAKAGALMCPCDSAARNPSVLPVLQGTVWDLEWDLYSPSRSDPTWCLFKPLPPPHPAPCSPSRKAQWPELPASVPLASLLASAHAAFYPWSASTAPSPGQALPLLQHLPSDDSSTQKPSEPRPCSPPHPPPMGGASLLCVPVIYRVHFYSHSAQGIDIYLDYLPRTGSRRIFMEGMREEREGGRGGTGRKGGGEKRGPSVHSQEPYLRPGLSSLISILPY